VPESHRIFLSPGSLKAALHLRQRLAEALPGRLLVGGGLGWLWRASLGGKKSLSGRLVLEKSEHLTTFKVLLLQTASFLFLLYFAKSQ